MPGALIFYAYTSELNKQQMNDKTNEYINAHVYVYAYAAYAYMHM